MDDIRRRFYDDDEEFVSLDQPAAGSSKAAAPGPPPAKRSRSDKGPVYNREEPAAPIERQNRDNEGELARILGAAQDESEFQQLIRAWQNERHSPVILQFQEHLLSRVLDEIRRQVGSCFLYLLYEIMLLNSHPNSQMMSAFYEETIIFRKRTII